MTHILFTGGVEVANDGQELDEISETLGEKTIRTSDDAEDGNVGRNDALSDLKSAPQKTLTAAAAAGDDDDVRIRDEDIGDAGLSMTRTCRLQTAKDSASSSDDAEEANDDLVNEDDDDSDEEQVHSL